MKLSKKDQIKLDSKNTHNNTSAITLITSNNELLNQDQVNIIKCKKFIKEHKYIIHKAMIEFRNCDEDGFNSELRILSAITVKYIKTKRINPTSIKWLLNYMEIIK